MKYIYYQLKKTCEEEIRSFFSTLFGFRLEYDIRVLEDKQYDKRCSKRSAACIQKTVVKGDPESENLLLRMNYVKRIIFIREKDKGVSVRSIAHEVLHGYYPT